MISLARFGTGLEVTNQLRTLRSSALSRDTTSPKDRSNKGSRPLVPRWIELVSYIGVDSFGKPLSLLVIIYSSYSYSCYSYYSTNYSCPSSCTVKEVIVSCSITLLHERVLTGYCSADSSIVPSKHLVLDADLVGFPARPFLLSVLSVWDPTTVAVLCERDKYNIPRQRDLAPSCAWTLRRRKQDATWRSLQSIMQLHSCLLLQYPLDLYSASPTFTTVILLQPEASARG